MQRSQYDRVMERRAHVINKMSSSPEAQRQALYVGRGSVWGNPHRVADSSRNHCVSLFIRDLKLMPADKRIEHLLPILRAVQNGRKLMCFCVPRLCHALVLVDWVLTHPEFEPFRHGS